MDIHFKFGNQFNSWAMAILALILLFTSTFFLIVGKVIKDRLIVVLSIAGLVAGALLGIYCLMQEGVL